MKTAKVLWLSDIHYCHKNKLFAKKINEQERKVKIESYFKSISVKIHEIKPTHILITGDLAFSGLYTDMEDMYDTILRKYMDGFPETRLIICCGNHECDRRFIMSPQVKEHLNSLLPVKIGDPKYNDRKKILKYLRKITLTQELQDIIRLIDNEFLSKIVKSEDNYFNYEELLFSGYKKFWENYVESRFNKINKFSKIIDVWHLNDNKGLYGVVLDKEYGLIFSVINTSWMAWGKTTYESVLGDVWSEQGEEYGNLTIDLTTLKKVDIVIKDLKSRGYTTSSNLISLQHHNNSFISYEEQYKNATNFNEYYSNQDIILSGHNHVPHFKASKFRGNALCFEAPQLFDYHWYTKEDTETDFFAYAIQNHGFSSFEFTRDHRNVVKRAYSLRNDDCMLNTGNNNFIWNELNEHTERFRFDKNHIKNIFDLNFETERNRDITLISYLELWKLENGLASVAFDFCHKKVNLCLDTYIKDYLPELNKQESINDKPTMGYHVFLDSNSLTYFVGKLDLGDEQKILFDIITFCSKKNIKNIKLLYLDFQIFNYFYRDSPKVGTFMDGIQLINQHFNAVKCSVMERFIKNDESVHKLRVGYDVVLVSKYKHYCYA